MDELSLGNHGEPECCHPRGGLELLGPLSRRVKVPEENQGQMGCWRNCRLTRHLRTRAHCLRSVTL